MIAQSDYMPKQMNGPIIASYAHALLSEIKKTNPVLDYLYGLSIETAQETELDNIGKLIGYPRPLVPEGFNSENILLLGSLPLEQDIQIGLSSCNSETGGQLSTVTISQTGFMDVNTYRKFLPKVAIIKRYGITMQSVDIICSAIGVPYDLSFNLYKDIEVRFSTSIGYKNVWILTQLFYRFATEPQVIVYSGG